MTMKYFLLRLNPPRPTFAQDQSQAESSVMQRHFAYWSALSQRGTAIVYGPVADPSGTWGVAIIAVERDEDATAIKAADPAILGQIGLRYDIFPMAQALIGQQPAGRS
jgi:uncharacterized protein YciI